MTKYNFNLFSEDDSSDDGEGDEARKRRTNPQVKGVAKRTKIGMSESKALSRLSLKCIVKLKYIAMANSFLKIVAALSIRIGHLSFCSSQPSMVQWLSSSIYPCLVVRPAMVTPDQISTFLIYTGI